MRDLNVDPFAAQREADKIAAIELAGKQTACATLAAAQDGLTGYAKIGRYNAFMAAMDSKGIVDFEKYDAYLEG